MSVIRIEALRLSRGTQEVLRGVSLQAERGETIALMGLSGGGKTTVLRAITALDPFDAGSIELDGVTLRPGPLPPRRNGQNLLGGGTCRLFRIYRIAQMKYGVSSQPISHRRFVKT